MRTLAVVQFLGALSSVFAQSSSTTSAEPSVQTIDVGSDGYNYSPNNITAAVGSTLVFRFMSEGHSVVKSAFGIPCEPYDLSHRGQPIFYSGSFSGSDTESVNPPTWNLTINDTQPTFFYCTAPNSCVGNHMIGVINPNSTMTLEAQNSLINSNTIMLKPGQSLAAEGSSNSSNGGSSLSGGAIAGIVVGAVFGIVAIAAFLWYMMRRHKQKARLQNTQVESQHTSSRPPHGNSMVVSNDTRWSESYRSSGYQEDKKLMATQDMRDLNGPTSPELGGFSIYEADGENGTGFKHAPTRDSVASELGGDVSYTRVQSSQFGTIHEMG